MLWVQIKNEIAVLKETSFEHLKEKLVEEYATLLHISCRFWVNKAQKANNSRTTTTFSKKSA